MAEHLNSFWQGVLDIFTWPSIQLRSKKLGSFEDDRRAITGDWNKVAKDMNDSLSQLRECDTYIVTATCVFKLRAKDAEDARMAVETIHDVGHIDEVLSIHIQHLTQR